jgi:hypothetical protein
MKISERTHPVLRYLRNPASILDAIPPREGLPMEEEEYTNILTCWLLNADFFKQNVFYVTEPFAAAVKRENEKLRSCLNPNMFSARQSGTLLYNNFSICYSMQWDNTHGVSVSFFVWAREYLLGAKHSPTKADLLCNSAFGYLSEPFMVSGMSREKKAVCHVLTGIILPTLLLMKHAPIEVKEIEAGKRLKDISCKYVNDAKSNIQILDTSWFTTTKVEGGIDVSGYLAHRWVGTGQNKERKLRWIEGHSRSGGIRPAKML